MNQAFADTKTTRVIFQPALASTQQNAAHPTRMTFRPALATAQPNVVRSTDKTPDIPWQDFRTLAALRQYHQIRRLDSYLRRAVRDHALSNEVATLSRRAWAQLNSLMNKRLSIPSACPALGGQLIYTWKLGSHHLELEIFPDAPSEFFYLNRKTDEDWDYTYNIGDQLPDEVVEKLSLFIVHDL